MNEIGADGSIAFSAYKNWVRGFSLFSLTDLTNRVQQVTASFPTFLNQPAVLKTKHVKLEAYPCVTKMAKIIRTKPWDRWVGAA